MRARTISPLEGLRPRTRCTGGHAHAALSALSLSSPSSAKAQGRTGASIKQACTLPRLANKQGCELKEPSETDSVIDRSLASRPADHSAGSLMLNTLGSGLTHRLARFTNMAAGFSADAPALIHDRLIKQIARAAGRRAGHSERHSNCNQPGPLHRDIQLFMPTYGELDDGERVAWFSLLRMHLPLAQ